MERLRFLPEDGRATPDGHNDWYEFQFTGWPVLPSPKLWWTGPFAFPVDITRPAWLSSSLGHKWNTHALSTTNYEKATDPHIRSTIQQDNDRSLCLDGLYLHPRRHSDDHLRQQPLRIIGIIYLLGPIFAGIFGFIFFVLFAAIYNLLAGWLGGFEVEIKNID